LVDKYADLIANDSERNNTVCNAVNLLRTPVSSGIFVFVFLIGNLRAKKSKGSDGFIWRRGRD
jgi:hypothetical protein